MGIRDQDKKNFMKIVIAGDFSPSQALERRFLEKSFAPTLGEIKPIVCQADISIVNFETTVADRHVDKPIKKHGPNLYCGEATVEAVKWAGFNVATLANNHIADYGGLAVERSIAELKSREIDCVGAGKNLAEAGKVLYKTVNDKTVAIVNCCEHEFSIASDDTAGANPLDPVRQFYAIAEARGKADAVIVIIHGGHEHFQLPSPRMQDTYRFFIDAGADVVVNHHQHCFSGMEEYKGKPIFYGLGNFCFDLPKPASKLWCEGFMLELNINGSGEITWQTHPYTQCEDPSSPCVKLMTDRQKFDETFRSISDTISDRKRLTEEVTRYYDSCKRSLSGLLQPYNGRISRAAYYRGLLPSFVTKEKALGLVNMVECESHLDKLRRILRQIAGGGNTLYIK